MSVFQSPWSPCSREWFVDLKQFRAGQEYRLLQKGERILQTDEFLEDDCKTWTPMNNQHRGNVYDGNFHVPIRRKRELATPNAELKHSRENQ